MRKITKTLSFQVDGTNRDFRLTKLDAFSGASLLRLVAKLPDGVSVENLLVQIPEADLHALMRVCLEHTEVLLPAGWAPVMTRGEWCFPDLEYDTAACLKLTIEEALWTLEGFFAAGASASQPGTPET